MEGNVLIVDDEYGIRMLLEEVFKSAGYQVNSADTGSKAMEMLLQTHVDLIVIDYKLPVLNGIEVIKKLESASEKIPVILMTGMVESVSAEERSMETIKHVLAKPFDIEDILNKAEEILK